MNKPLSAPKPIIQRWVRITLIWLVITAVLGTWLRVYPFFPTEEIPYPFLLHGHSHVAFLGWIFNAFFILLTSHYLLTDKNQVFYNRLFIWMQVMVTGMLIFFPLYGYNPLTIAISSVHTALTIVFAVKFFRHTRSKQHAQQASLLALNLALCFMLVSAIGPLLLAPLAISGMKTTIWYNLAIYFYLHFQYNGWFFFGMTGLTFLLLEKQGIRFHKPDASRFIWLNAAAVVPAYSLSALWTAPPGWVYGMAFLSTSAQLFSLVYLYRILAPVCRRLPHYFPSGTIRVLLVIAFLALAGRNLLQVGGSLPGLAELVAQNRFLIIAFLHLIFLGMLTPFLMAVFMLENWVKAERWSAGAGILLYLLSVGVSELILFMSPVSLSPFTPELLIVMALLTTLGILAWVSGWQKIS